jgi:hypothetical protein
LVMAGRTQVGGYFIEVEADDPLIDSVEWQP